MTAFASAAISAQGTLIQLDSTGGASVETATITAITATNPPVITATNTFADGDHVKVTGVVGMTQINNLSGIVGSRLSGSFSLLGVNASTFSAYTSGGLVTQSAFSDVCEAKTFNAFDGQASEIDVTTMCSEAKEIRLGLQDFGGFTFDMNYVPTDAAQIAMQALKAGGDVGHFRLLLPDNIGYWKFDAFVKSFPISGGVDGVLMSSMALRITGAPIYTSGAAPL